MFGNRIVRVGLIGFIALMGIAWFAKPKSLNSEIAALGIHLEKTNLVKAAVVHSRNGDMFDISKEDLTKLYAYLRSHEFTDISGAMATKSSGITWLNRPSKTWPYRKYQHVWLSDGPEPQVQFEPPLR